MKKLFVGLLLRDRMKKKLDKSGPVFLLPDAIFILSKNVVSSKARSDFISGFIQTSPHMWVNESYKRVVHFFLY